MWAVADPPHRDLHHSWLVRQSLCFFLNMYHTLVQHAFLLLGPPSSKDWSSFYSTVGW
jgi:hypothetical protein